MTGILETINSPQDLKGLTSRQMELLAAEARQFLTEVVAEKGGHLAPNLGVVELTLALHSVFDSPKDKIIWDVGHQSYVHKLITGRRDGFKTLREYGGMAGFPKKKESEHDPFETGHSSTSISAALGIACARDLAGEKFKVVAVIGDGALSGGMALEALNQAGDIKNDLLVVLNDNEMSINENVGGLAAYLGRVRTDPKYTKLKEDVEDLLKRIPAIGGRVVKSVERVKDSFKYLVVPGMLFEELGFTYVGPENGHNIKGLMDVMRRVKQIKGPVLLHVVTKKGKGYCHAEEKPAKFHGIGPFDIHTACPVTTITKPNYTDIFGSTLADLAEKRKDIIAITAAMAGGTGLERFASLYPDRFFDVGIAEQHAVTFAAGMASRGFKPVVTIYSTFLQRAYDQILHDVAQQGLPVIFAVDRAGVVGEDGPTHHGLFDLSYLRSIPGLTLMAPKDMEELRHMLYTSLTCQGPCAIRYPRSAGEGACLNAPYQKLPVPQSELIHDGEDLAVFALGSMVAPALEAALRLSRHGLKAAVINARFAAPLDREMICKWAKKCHRFVTVEENILSGGFGSGLLEVLEEEGIYNVQVKRLGVPTEFVTHGPRKKLLQLQGLDADGIYEACRSFCRYKVREAR
jgi:1-deoxy-D-xylulose-5-phosphate synthase